MAPGLCGGWDAAGQPVGVPWATRRTPLVQVTATTDDQTANTWAPLLEMLRGSPAQDAYDVDPLDSFVTMRRGRIEKRTSSATSVKGARAVMAVLDQTETWVPGNGGPKLAKTLRNNATKLGGVTIETPNAYTIGENSVAETTARYAEQIKAGMIAANSITANKLQIGAVDGQVITGATIQSERASNRGIKISSSGMQVYASNGWKALDINAQTGAISISGHISRRDTWSQVWLNDVVSRESGLDEYSGFKWGCGLAFNSLEDDWWDGTISLNKASNGDPSLRIQGPYPKRLGKSSPYISVGTAAIAMYTPAANASFSFNSLGLALQAQDVYWWMNNQGFSFGIKSDNLPRLYVGRGELQIRTLDEKDARFWANKNTTTMQFGNQNQVWIANNGVHITGTKNFSMRVPGLSSQRGGLWLEHACTESPYDGIEYWENIELDAEGHARWVLPDYVPRIASAKAPWIVLASDGARAVLDRSNTEEWHVDVAGAPSTTVAVLVKGARMIDHEVAEDGAVRRARAASGQSGELPAIEIHAGSPGGRCRKRREARRRAR